MKLLLKIIILLNLQLWATLLVAQKCRNNSEVDLFQLAYHFKEKADIHHFLAKDCAKTSESMYLNYTQTGNVEMLKSASNAMEMIDKALDILRIAYQSNDSLDLLLTQSKDYYENGISIAFALYKLTKSEDYLEQAFRYIEKSKSILLIEEVKSDSELANSFLPDSLVIEEKSLSTSIEHYKEKICDAQNYKESVQQALLKDTLIQKKRAHDLLINIIKQQFPKYHSLRYDISYATMKQLKSSLDDQAMLVEYFYGQKHIYALAISKHTVTPLIIDIDHLLEENIDNLIQGFERKQFNKEASFFVFTKILNPIISLGKLSHIQQLTFVPDGVLHYIPFEILITSKGEPGNNEFLIHDYTINYLHSANLADLYQSNDQQNTSFLGFSPEYNIESNAKLTSRSSVEFHLEGIFEKLPMAIKEVKSTASIWNGNAFFSEKATEENFKREAQHAGIIHIASHAIIDDEEPMNSKLVFSPGADTHEDGLLHIYELYNMKLNAQLACLSACNTGFGKIRDGEGVVSLAKGFFYAGVPNVMMSLWSVPDQSTSEIMTDFYKELKNGAGKADALRNAKLNYLKSADENTTDPYYWAAITLIGDNEPLNTSARFPYGICTIIFVLTAAGGFCCKKRKS